MSGDLNNKPPRSFYIMGGAALVWNLIGVMQYVTRVSMSEAAVAGLPANQQAFLQDIPGWATAAFAIATNAAALGCVLLLLRKAWAYPLFIMSLLALLVQNYHGFVLADGAAAFGAGGVVLTILIIAIGAYLIWYSIGAKDKGWIS